MQCFLLLREEKEWVPSGCAGFFNRGWMKVRFETEGHGNFLLGNQLLSPHSIKSGSFLLVEL